jgi:hypothetical protein
MATSLFLRYSVWYFLVGYLTKKIYRNNSRTKALKGNMELDISGQQQHPKPQSAWKFAKNVSEQMENIFRLS